MLLQISLLPILEHEASSLTCLQPEVAKPAACNKPKPHTALVHLHAEVRSSMIVQTECGFVWFRYRGISRGSRSGICPAFSMYVSGKSHLGLEGVLVKDTKVRQQLV